MELLNDESKMKKSDNNLERISPFELKDRLIRLADEKVRKMAFTMLNAGRGNPNWIATQAREAFFTLGLFGIEESKETFFMEEGIAGIPTKQGIASRFELFLQKHSDAPGIELLKKFYNYMLMKHAVDPDELVHEWAESMMGNQYPVPDRILKYTEMIVRDYLFAELWGGVEPKDTVDLFATEGSTAGMCYVFMSLEANFLLEPGDSVALLTPIFTPYIEIPELPHYHYDVLNIQANTMDANGLHTWQYKPEDIYKLRDPKYKAVYIVNPSNPPSYQMDRASVEALKDVVERWNPNLMIITDDVYASYVPGYKSIIADIPFNSISLYSFSKYFGATGWRIAAIALEQENIFDKLISELPRKRKTELNERYGSLTTDVESMKFIDRMVADSRQVALNHTAGLSLPQQMQMSLFAADSILDTENIYRKRMLKLINDRLTALWDNTGFTLPKDPLRAGYYSEIDMLVWAKKYYGDEFVEYLKKTYNPLDVVFRLATETGCVLLNGGGFDGPEWSVRVSLANLNETDYVKIGQHIRSILTQYADLWKSAKDGTTPTAANDKK